MASLIKNQVLKHLTKFFKDLAPEQLQLSAFKGSCELSNLQLEEKVLMDLLSFPAWVRINKAVCDQLSIKIPWTKIKSVPIQMNLNEVTVEVEVCEEFRDTIEGEESDNLANIINNQAPGKYGFVNRVIDGITVTVNNILIVFKSKLMSATFNLSRVLLESRCPNWKPGDLSLTKIKDTKRGQILLFKVVDWQTMRLEAKCLTDPNQAPLRLITNHAQCRLTIKKNLNDCSVVAARIFVIFEDILWVLTFAQFISTASFVEYVFSLIKRSPISKKTGLLQDNQSAMYSTSGNGPTPNTSLNMSGMSSSSFGPQLNSAASSALNSPMHSSKQNEKAPILTGNLSSASLLEQKFLCYDLVETSLHLYIDKVDAHLYDDIETSQSSGSSRDSGGALQTTLDQIQVDCYPYSRATSDRKHWYQWFDPSPSSRRQWIKNHFVDFELSKARKSKLQKDIEITKEGDNLFSTSASNNATGVISQHSKQSSNLSKSHQALGSIDEQLLSLTVLIKIKDYCMNCVSTKHTARGVGLNKFIETDKDYHMPSEMPALYLELNYFYYFDAINRMMIYENVPDPLAFMHLSPTKLMFDSPTLVFLHSFHVNLSKAFVHLNDLFPQETSAPSIHCRVEILMPQIILPAKKSQNEQVPETATSSLLVKSGKITLSSSIYDREVLAKLMSSIEKLKENPCQPINLGSNGNGNFARKDNTCSGDWTRVWNSSLIGGTGNEFNIHNQLWAIQFEPIWMDFMNYDVDQLASGRRLEPIVEPVNAYAFIHLDLSSASSGDNIKVVSSDTIKKRDVISIMFTVLDGSILANMDKIQFGFLQRLVMHAEKMIQQIRKDASSIIQLDTVVEDTLEINLTAYIKEIKARLILDKKIDSSQLITESDSSQTNMGILQNQPNLITDEAPKSTQKLSNNYYSSLSAISNPFEGKSKVEAVHLSEETFSSLPAAVIDSAELDNSEDLDECIEVADDTSCLIFGDTSLLAHEKDSAGPNDRVPDLECAAKGSSSALDFEKPSNNVQAGCSSSGSAGEGSTSGLAPCFGDSSIPSARSVGKSPIEESLLINLEDIEQSSKLFAKMKVQRQPTALFESAPDSEVPPPSSQQQEIETESISYLELSMSQLMVRRITETKRRQKF